VLKDLCGVDYSELDPTPWFSDYREVFMDKLRYYKADFLDQPIGCILFVNASNINESVEFVQRIFGNVKNWPSNFRTKHWDPTSVHFSCILLKDNQDPSSDLET
jgi:hypothetical protein